MPSVEGSPDEPAVARFGVRAADVVDLFAYTVVLGLFAEFVPAVIGETFLLVVLTAMLMKLVLEWRCGPRPRCCTA